MGIEVSRVVDHQPSALPPEGGKRIVIVGAAPTSLVNFRGPLLQELIRRGHQVTACAPGAAPSIRRKLEEMGVTYVDIPCDRTGTNLRHDLKLFLALVALFRSSQPDAALFYMIKPIIYGSLAARVAGVPRIYSMITGLGYALTGDGLGRRVIRSASIVLLRLSLKSNRAVFFQNPDNQAHFKRLRLIHAGQQAVLINGSGVDLRLFQPVPLPKRISFLLIARLLAEKGIREYATAAQLIRWRHPDVLFRLVGPFDRHPAALREAEVKGWVDLGLMQYLGRLEDVRPAIAAASVYVLPSYYPEGTPRSVLEAMAMGRAIVTTDAAGCRETVRPGVNGFLVPARDPEALAHALERFILEPDLIPRMGRESRRLAVEKYDVRQVNAAIVQTMGLSS